VEGACHKGVVLGGVAKNNQLGGADALPVRRSLGGVHNHAAHNPHGVQIDPRLCGADVHRGADEFRLAQRLGNGGDKLTVAGGKTLLHQGGIPADKVDAHLFGRAVQGVGVPHHVPSGSARQYGDGGHRNALVDNGDSVLLLDFIAGPHKLPGPGGDFVVHLLAGARNIAVHAVQQRNTHGDGADVQVLLLNHGDGFQNIADIIHTKTSLRRKTADVGEC